MSGGLLLMRLRLEWMRYLLRSFLDLWSVAFGVEYGYIDGL